MFVLTEGTIESSYLECGSHHLWKFFFSKDVDLELVAGHC